MDTITYEDISDDLLYISLLLNDKPNTNFNSELEIVILEEAVAKLKNMTLKSNHFKTEN